MAADGLPMGTAVERCLLGRRSAPGCVDYAAGTASPERPGAGGGGAAVRGGTGVATRLPGIRRLRRKSAIGAVPARTGWAALPGDLDARLSAEIAQMWAGIVALE
jgi:hypothetical protein